MEIDSIDTNPDRNPTPPETIQTLIDPPKPQQENTITSLPLSFSVSTNLIDFGSLNPGNPVSRVLELTVLGDSMGYHVYAFSDHSLKNKNNDTLPDTTCDDGSCSEIRESPWSTNLTYGFGYRCDPSSQSGLSLGSDCLEFAEEDLYKQFADQSKKEQPQIIMAGLLAGQKKTSEITFKINSSVNQKPGSYNNNVTFIAVPNY